METHIHVYIYINTMYVCVYIYIYMCVCVCGNPVSKGLPVLPQNFAGGWRRCGGAPPNEALLHTSGNVPELDCAWAPSWAAGGTFTFIFIFISPRATSFPVSDVAGQDPYPIRIISFVLHAIPSVWRAWHRKISFSVHHHRHHQQHHPPSEHTGGSGRDVV